MVCFERCTNWPCLLWLVETRNVHNTQLLGDCSLLHRLRSHRSWEDTISTFILMCHLCFETILNHHHTIADSGLPRSSLCHCQWSWSEAKTKFSITRSRIVHQLLCFLLIFVVWNVKIILELVFTNRFHNKNELYIFHDSNQLSPICHLPFIKLQLDYFL